MIGHTIEKNVDIVPTSQSKTIIQNWLRDAFHFNGVVITDDMEMASAKMNNQSIAQAIITSLQAGSDMILLSGHTTSETERIEIFKEVVGVIKNGALTQQQIDGKLSRILSIKEGLK
jgi:beta-N-acetylhexosaminidase